MEEKSRKRVPLSPLEDSRKMKRSWTGTIKYLPSLNHETLSNRLLDDIPSSVLTKKDTEELIDLFYTRKKDELHQSPEGRLRFRKICLDFRCFLRSQHFCTIELDSILVHYEAFLSNLSPHEHPLNVGAAFRTLSILANWIETLLSEDFHPRAHL